MVPNTLNDWTYETITALCTAGQPESDRHDFKFNLAELRDATKICCAFANTFGGFVIVGVKDARAGNFAVVGLEADKELNGKFLAKVKADPDINISSPKTIGIPGSNKVLYVFEVPRSSRRPHLPTIADQRTFWKRQGSDCVQMTLEEIRYQMNSYEEKREKLALLLIDLHNKLRSLGEQADMPDRSYNGDVYSFEIIDRVVADAFAILKADVNTIGALDTIKRRLMLVNAQKQQMLSVLSLSYEQPTKDHYVNVVRKTAKDVIPGVTILVEQIERSLKEKFGIENPYSPSPRVSG